MLMHSFVLDALGTTGADTFSHFEMLIDEHRKMENEALLSSGGALSTGGVSTSSNTSGKNRSRLRVLVPTVGTFHTRLPLRRAFEAYNKKYAITKRRHVCISFNEIRHILNLAQIMALRGVGNVAGDSEVAKGDESEEDEKALSRWHSGLDSPSFILSDADLLLGKTGTKAMTPTPPPPLNLASTPENGEEPQTLDHAPFKGPKMITFDGDQTLYSDGANFESNPKLANYLYLLLRHGVTVAVVTAAGYEYEVAKYELRLSGLLAFFKERDLPEEDCARFYLFGGECNYLMNLGNDYKLHAVKEFGPGGWLTSTKYQLESPVNWDDDSVKVLLDAAESTFRSSMDEQKLRARVIRKKRAVGLIPKADEQIPREALDETVLRVQAELQHTGTDLPFCAFNGGRDAWVDVGNKRVGVQILQSYLGLSAVETLHIGDQFLNTGNDYAARDVCPCVWITSPEETTYILKSILRLAGVSLIGMSGCPSSQEGTGAVSPDRKVSDSNCVDGQNKADVDFSEIERRTEMVQLMDVYTGELKTIPK